MGFPLVSLGFALKSFIGSKLKQRTRNDVARQNDLLYTVLWDALPAILSTPVNNNEASLSKKLIDKTRQYSLSIKLRRKVDQFQFCRMIDHFLRIFNAKYSFDMGSFDFFLEKMSKTLKCNFKYLVSEISLIFFTDGSHDSG